MPDLAYIDRERHVFCFDVDCTLFDYPAQFEVWLKSRNYRRAEGKEALRPGAPNNYILRYYPELTRETMALELDEFNISASFEDLNLMPGLLDGWHALKTAYPNSLFIGLSSMGHHTGMVEMRRRQLSRLDLDQFIPVDLHGIKAPYVKELGGNMLFEDSPNQLEAALEAGIPAIAVDWPFNRDARATARLTDWRKVTDIVAEVLQKSASEAA